MELFLLATLGLLAVAAVQVLEDKFLDRSRRGGNQRQRNVHKDWTGFSPVAVDLSVSKARQ